MTASRPLAMFVGRPATCSRHAPNETQGNSDSIAPKRVVCDNCCTERPPREGPTTNEVLKVQPVDVVDNTVHVLLIMTHTDTGRDKLMMGEGSDLSPVGMHTTKHTQEQIDVNTDPGPMWRNLLKTQTLL